VTRRNKKKLTGVYSGRKKERTAPTGRKVKKFRLLPVRGRSRRFLTTGAHRARRKRRKGEESRHISPFWGEEQIERLPDPGKKGRKRARRHPSSPPLRDEREKKRKPPPQKTTDSPKTKREKIRSIFASLCSSVEEKKKREEGGKSAHHLRSDKKRSQVTGVVGCLTFSLSCEKERKKKNPTALFRLRESPHKPSLPLGID